MQNTREEFVKLLQLSYRTTKPWIIASLILSFLLLISLSINIYMLVQ
ncbi:MAG: hypothetical protein IJ564_00010 [Alphaproteobacteria bacterium]|nr:hypothetical protein [Alphaproteobacteria bacterium]